MPTSTSFTALGGFPFCPTKVDVSDFDKWTTLGGNKKGGSVTETGKGLAEAMKLFWNLNGVSGSIYDDSFTIDLDAGDYDASSWVKIVDPPETESDVNKEPNERVCYSLWGATNGEDPDDFESPYVGMRGNIIGMYDGDTDDEDNFVGFGSSAFSAVYEGLFSALVLRAYFDDPADTGSVEYIEFAGMQFVAVWVAEAAPGTTIAITGGTTVTVKSNGTTVATLSSPSFYTY